MDPGAIRQRLYLILEHAQCKRVRFHDLRRTFVTTALGSGMDVKTLSTMLGHVSAATTRGIYAHTREECEEKLKALIVEMKAEQAELKEQKTKSTLS